MISIQDMPMSFRLDGKMRFKEGEHDVALKIISVCDENLAVPLFLCTHFPFRPVWVGKRESKIFAL